MKTQKVKANLSYSSKPTEFVCVWEQLLRYVQSYEYEIDKIIWVGELEHGWVSVFPGSKGDADDPDVPLAMQFHLPGLWSDEPDELSENDRRFRLAYKKRKSWLVKNVKTSWHLFDDRQSLLDEAVNGKLGIYFAEYFDCLSLPALTYLCGTKIEILPETNEQLIENFCKKYDVVRKYFFPEAPRRRNMLYLNSERMDSLAFTKDLSQLLTCFPNRKKLYLGQYYSDDLPIKRRTEIETATGIKVVHMTDAQDDAFLEAVDRHDMANW